VGPRREREKPGPKPTGSKSKLSFKEKRELETLPVQIEALEAEQARLKMETESPAFYKESADHIKRVLERLEAIGPEIDEATARWVVLDERA
jgi:ATP-binding cassette subfamily F protein uup